MKADTVYVELIKTHVEFRYLHIFSMFSNVNGQNEKHIF